MATITEIEVEFVLWEAEDPLDRPCENPAMCANVAVYRVKFGPAEQVSIDCQCLCRNRTKMCLPCYDRFSQPGVITCVECNRFKVIDSAEPIR